MLIPPVGAHRRRQGRRSDGRRDGEVRRDSVGFDAKLAALLTLAREMTANQGAVADASWNRALDAGWSGTELTELSTHVTLNLSLNYFNQFVDTELDLSAVPIAVTS